jgi:fructoselysine-6-P-deglycase FrlB-like protein
MQLRLNDPGYTDRLANFLRSLGQAVLVAGPAQLDIDLPADSSAREELEIYLRVWRVLYPDTEVQVENDEGESPAA